MAKDKTVIVREVFVKILAMVFGRVNEEQRTILASVLKGYEQDEEGRMLLSK